MKDASRFLGGDVEEEATAGDRESGRESGMVTVETALSLGAIMMVVLAVLVAIAAGTTHATLCNAARAGARAYSLGQDASAAASLVSSRVGQVLVEDASGWFTVRVTGAAMQLGQWQTLPITCEIRAHREPFITGLP